MVKINRQLNLVIPIDRDDGTTAYVHSSPIGRPVFEANHLLIAKTFTQIFTGGLGITAGPRVCALVMRDVAATMQIDADTSLFDEIRRLTNVLAQGSDGWQTLPYHDAIKQGLISDDDAAEVDNALAFFTVVCAMHRRPVAESMMDTSAGLWGAQITSLAPTAFITSLKISTPPDTTGAKETVSSIPR